MLIDLCSQASKFSARMPHPSLNPIPPIDPAAALRQAVNAWLKQLVGFKPEKAGDQVHIPNLNLGPVGLVV